MEKSSKVLKIILGILIFLLIFGLVTFFINKKRVEENKPPLPFTTITIAGYADNIGFKDGPSRECIGLGYKINRYCYTGLEIESQVVHEIGGYSLKFDKEKNEPLVYKIEETVYAYYCRLIDSRLTTEESVENFKRIVSECYEQYLNKYGENKDLEKINEEVMKYFNTEESLINIQEE